MRILVIDNYDSFTYNLVQYLGELSDPPHEIEVVRNDHASVDELLHARLRPRDRLARAVHARTRPGSASRPCRRFPLAKIPTLGVCLGHQALVQAWGGKVIRHEPVHGKTSTIEHDGRTIFTGLPQDARGRPLPLAGRRPTICRTCSSAAPPAAAW